MKKQEINVTKTGPDSSTNIIPSTTASVLNIYEGDSEQILKQFPSNKFDSVVCDPPYGLSQETFKSDFTAKILSSWLRNQSINQTGKGIDNAEWDFCVPPPSLWKEVFRVLKPGAYLAAFGSPRTDHLLKISLVLAGFQIVDTIAFIHNGGFPKNQDCGKAIETRFREWGHKPLSTHSDIEKNITPVVDNNVSFFTRHTKRIAKNKTIVAPSHQKSNKWSDYKTELKSAFEPIVIARKSINFNLAHNLIQYNCGAMNIGACRIPLAKDEKPSKSLNPDGRHPPNVIGNLGMENDKFFMPYSNDNSRYKICPKPHDDQVNKYMPDGVNNTHPTPKHFELLKWLTRLVTPEGGTTLDPFMGSGSGGIAAIEEGFGYVGIELDPEYHRIAQMRLTNLTNQRNKAV